MNASAPRTDLGTHTWLRASAAAPSMLARAVARRRKPLRSPSSRCYTRIEAGNKRDPDAHDPSPRAPWEGADARTGPPASQLRLGTAIRGRVAGEAGPSAAAQLCDPLRGTIGRAARGPSNHAASISLELLAKVASDMKASSSIASRRAKGEPHIQWRMGVSGGPGTAASFQGNVRGISMTHTRRKDSACAVSRRKITDDVLAKGGSRQGRAASRTDDARVQTNTVRTKYGPARCMYDCSGMLSL